MVYVFLVTIDFASVVNHRACNSFVVCMNRYSIVKISAYASRPYITTITPTSAFEILNGYVYIGGKDSESSKSVNFIPTTRQLTAKDVAVQLYAIVRDTESNVPNVPKSYAISYHNSEPPDKPAPAVCGTFVHQMDFSKDASCDVEESSHEVNPRYKGDCKLVGVL